MANHCCDYCKREISPEWQAYGLKIELYALAEPLVLTAQDLEQDYAAELEALIEKMETLDVSEAEDQVHEGYSFILCPHCRHSLHERLKHRRIVGRG